MVLIAIFSKLGLAYECTGQIQKALSYYQKIVSDKSVSTPLVIKILENIIRAYDDIGDVDKRKSYQIQQTQYLMKLRQEQMTAKSTKLKDKSQSATYLPLDRMLHQVLAGEPSFVMSLRGNEEIMKSVIAYTEPSTGTSFLMASSGIGCMPLIRAIVDTFEDKNSILNALDLQDGLGHSALAWACQSGQADVVEYLLQLGGGAQMQKLPKKSLKKWPKSVLQVLMDFAKRDKKKAKSTEQKNSSKKETDKNHSTPKGTIKQESGSKNEKKSTRKGEESIASEIPPPSKPHPTTRTSASAVKGTPLSAAAALAVCALQESDVDAFLFPTHGGAQSSFVAPLYTPLSTQKTTTKSKTKMVSNDGETPKPTSSFDAAPKSAAAARGDLAGRTLEAWTPTSADAEKDTLEGNTEASDWDQFETNRRLFGVSSEFPEEQYTTRLNKANITKEQEEKAAKMAKEISKGSKKKKNVSETDEEARYGAVLNSGAYGEGAIDKGDNDDTFTDASITKKCEKN